MKSSGHFLPLLLGGVLLVSATPGCRSLGPRTIPKDRADYSEAIGDSWMRQTLLNIVKLRYNTPPVFVDVASVVGGYSAETEAGGFVTFGFPGTDNLNLNGKFRYTDRPTITYTPMTGNKFMRGLLIPIRPEEIFFCVQAGWSAEVILKAGLASINGLRNREFSPGGATAADPGFDRVLQLMERIRQSGLVGVRIEVDEQGRQTALLTIHDANITGDVLNDVRGLRSLLRLNSEVHEFKLVFGSVPMNDREVAVRTRSLVQIMSLISSEMEVPAEHIAEGRTIPGPRYADRPLIHIHCSPDKPTDAAVAVQHRGHWFWVDDRDVPSKRGFSFLMLLFTLADAGEQQNLPLITIPAQ
jgi:hypothetical protein